MSILYFEPQVGGHRAEYLGAFLEKFPDKISLACPVGLIDRLPSNLREKALKGTSVNFAPIEEMNESGLLATRSAWAQSIGMARSADCNLIFHPLIDQFVKYQHFLEETAIPVCGIYFRPIFHYSDLNARERITAAGQQFFLERFLARDDVIRIFTPDRFVSEWTKKSTLPAEKIQYIPDLVSFSPKSLEIKDSETAGQSKKTHFALFGALQARKGIFELLDAIEALPCDLAAKSRFTIAGQLYEDAKGFSDKVARLSKNSPAEICFNNLFLPKSDIERLVKDSDVILAPYLRHRGSSGVLYWAAAFGKPVITQDFGLIGLEVSRFRLGATTPSGDSMALAQLFEQVIQGHSIPFSPEGQAAYIAGHDSSSFIAPVKKVLQQLGKPN